MSGYPARWAAAVVGAGLLTAGLPAASGRASAGPTAPVFASVRNQSGPFETGNLLDYANADFEGTIGVWAGGSNAKLSDDTSRSFLHHDSLRDTAPAGGTSSFLIQGTPNAIKIILHPGSDGARYRVGAYFKTSGAPGETVEFSLGCRNSSGTYLGEWNGTPHKLASTTTWQYSEDDISVPPDCAYVQGSPKVTLAGLPANASVNMDEVIFAPYRAAVIIGAKGQAHADGKPYYDAQDWIDTNRKIGPLQSDKEFYGGNAPSLPDEWDDPVNTCYQIEKAIGATQSAKWPACVTNFADFESEAQIQAYFNGLPAAQMVIMVYHGEPEGKAFSCPVPHPPARDAARYVCSFDLESRYIRQAAAAVGDVPNVFVAMDSSTYEYGGGPHDSAGTSCAWIPPAAYTDFYLADHYDLAANGWRLPYETNYSGPKWVHWLSCVQRLHKPIGLAEYGLDCTTNPDQPVVTHEMAADDSYLAAIPHATEPTIMWEYWYSDNRNKWPGCIFNNTGVYNGIGGITQWRSGETQNGGG